MTGIRTGHGKAPAGRRRRGRRIRKLRRIGLGAGIAAAAVFAAVSWNLYRERKATEAEIAARSLQAETAGEAQGPDVIQYQGKTYRRNTYVKAVLCLGVDREGSMTEETTPGFGGQADGIFLAAQDTARNRIKVLMIPRDTMTEITMTDLSGNVLGKDTHHLTLAYTYGNGRETSCEYVKEAVSGLLGGLEIDYYLAADLDAIGILNDAVGGVRVTIDVDGLEEQDPELKKGATVTLTGEQAEKFVRYRDTGKDHSALYRMDQQQEYLIGFFEAAKARASADQDLAADLFEQMEDSMVTDLSKDQYLKLAMDALETEGLGEENFYTVPGTGVTTARYDEFYADEEALMPLVLEMFYREAE